MEGGELLVGALVLGAGFLFLRSSAPPVGAPTGLPPGAAGPGQVTTSNLVPPLPGVGQAYAVLKPIADHFTTPLINKINSTLGTSASPYAPGLPGTGNLNVTLNPGGTQTVSVKNPSWYSRNIGEPVSKSATGVVHAIEGLL